MMISEEQLRGLLTYEALMPAIREALRAYSAGRVAMPLRTVVYVKEHAGWFASMPAVYGNVMGAKLVTFYSGNAALGLPTHLATIQLLDAVTGAPLATIDGRLITEMRTAAVSAVAVDLLAGADARVLAILGSGVKARSNVAALALVRGFEEIRVWSRTPGNAERFASEAGGTSMSAEAAVTGADVVLTLTAASEPVLQGRWLKPGAFVCAVGSVTPERRELDALAMSGPKVVESREAAAVEAAISDCVELGELLNGAVLERNGYPVVFKSLGVAVSDFAAAKPVYDLIRR